MDLDADFKFVPLPPIPPAPSVALPSSIARLSAPIDAGLVGVPVHPVLPNPLGPLADLPGRWTGKGFNAIWRPHFGEQDRFLELNTTVDVIEFTEIPGDIPNRGLLQPDIVMRGLTYLQQVSDAPTNSGLHVEPGVWAVVPATSNPSEPRSVVRMGSIPHGTTILAQGVAIPDVPAPVIQATDLIPFPIGKPGLKTSFAVAEQTFPELNLSRPSDFRLLDADVTQAMVIDPNSVLAAALAGETVVRTTVLDISSLPKPVLGGGTTNTAFLQGEAAGPNAVAAEVDAVFWIEHVKGKDGAEVLQLQYTQTVILNFNGLSWPHVSVGTLRKEVPKPAPGPS